MAFDPPLLLARTVVGASAGLGLSGVLLAESAPDVSSLGGLAIVSLATAAITAVGTGFFQPWLRTKDLGARLEALERENADLRSKIERQDANERNMLTRLAALAEQATRMNDRNLKLAHALLVQTGRISPGTAADTLRAKGPEPGEALAGPPVLLVEDDLRSREAMAMMLEHRGYSVRVATCLAEAVAALDSAAFESVVLDLMLPDGDGAEVLQRVRDMGLPTRVVVTTGRDVGELGDVLALAPFAVLRKPIQFDAGLLPALRGEKPAMSVN